MRLNAFNCSLIQSDGQGSLWGLGRGARGVRFALDGKFPSGGPNGSNRIKLGRICLKR